MYVSRVLSSIDIHRCHARWSLPLHEGNYITVTILAISMLNSKVLTISNELEPGPVLVDVIYSSQERDGAACGMDFVLR